MYKTCNVQNLKSLAYHYGHCSVSDETLGMAILTYDKSRRELAQLLEVPVNFLRKLRLKKFPVSPDISFNVDQALQEEFDKIDSNKRIGDLTEEEADIVERHYFLEKNAECNFSTVNKLVAGIYDRLDRDFWFKKEIFLSARHLGKKLNECFAALISEYPYHQQELEKLKSMIFNQVFINKFSTLPEHTQPVIICHNHQLEFTAIFRRMADILGIKFNYIDNVTSQSKNYFDNSNKYPLALNVVEFNDRSHDIESDLEKVIEYYKTGNFGDKNLLDSGLMRLFELNFEDDDDEDITAEKKEDKILDFCFRNHINIFIYRVTSQIELNKEQSAEQMKYKILDFYENDYNQNQNERSYYTNLKFVKLLNIANNDNMIYFSQGDRNSKISVLERKAREYIESLPETFLKLSYSDLNKLILLTITKEGNYTMPELETSLKNLLRKIYELQISAAGRHEPAIKFIPPYHQLSPLIEQDDLIQITPLMLDYCEETFFQHNLKSKFSLTYSPEYQQIRVTDFATVKIIRNDKFVVKRPDLRLDDVVGCKEIKKRFKNIIEYFQNDDLYRAQNLNISPRILLSGPPGTGKTLIAQAFAGEIGFPFYSLSAAEVTSQKWAGWGASLLRDIFQKAKKNSHAVIFLDELDAFGSRSSFSDNDSGVSYDARSIMNSLLVLLDGVEDNSNIVVIGATNRPEDLDKALTRSKRFGLKFEIPPLTPQERLQLIKRHLAPQECKSDYQELLTHIKNRTYGDFTPAKIVEIIDETKLFAIIENNDKVTIEYFDQVIDRIVLGAKIKQLDSSYKESIAFHEAGHAVAFKHLFPMKTINRLSIGFRNNSLGVTVFGTGNDKDFFSLIRSQHLIKYIVIALAGMQAEKINSGNWDIGSEEDMLLATELSAYLACNIDLGYGVKPAIDYHLRSSDYENSSAENMVRDIITQLVEKCLEYANMILKDNWAHVQKLAIALQKTEDLSQKEIDKILVNLPPNGENTLDKIKKQLRIVDTKHSHS